MNVDFSCYNSSISSRHRVKTILGKVCHRPAKLDAKLAREIKNLCDPTIDPYETVMGKTMCTYDFYEGQGRLDGAFCEYTENDKMEYLEKLKNAGVVNIEMECELAKCLNKLTVETKIVFFEIFQQQSSLHSHIMLASKLQSVASHFSIV